MSEIKQKRKSKTIWFNLATIAVALAGVGFGFVSELGLSPMAAMKASMALTAVNTIGNLYLRTITTGPVS
mgnify:CR=1 FL=1|tara:strand:+ start:199 stop:408 length:210 start_codon:yes stop_codon:yes gene_type:complete